MDKETAYRALTGDTPDQDALIRKYAEIAERIYEDRTAGDFTWNGFLFAFLQEVKGE